MTTIYIKYIIMGICSLVKAKYMVRPTKCRVVSSLPDVTYFKPAGIPCGFLSSVCLSVEEVEALRLKDLEGLDQVEGAVNMGVSRPTFQRILSSARKKVSDALLNGKAIKIEGGNFQINAQRVCCRKRHAMTNSDNVRDINTPRSPADDVAGNGIDIPCEAMPDDVENG